VGSLPGSRRRRHHFTTIQSAVDAATPGDWILIAPGDYHEEGTWGRTPSAADLADGWYGGVDISTLGSISAAWTATP